MAAATRLPNLGSRRYLHAVVVALGWIGFVWMWILVAQRPWDSLRLIWLIVGSTVALPLLTFAWVAHNRALYRRKGERRAVARADTTYGHDWHGREVDADWRELRASRDISVSVVGYRKRYRITAASATARLQSDPGRSG